MVYQISSSRESCYRISLRIRCIFVFFFSFILYSILCVFGFLFFFALLSCFFVTFLVVHQIMDVV